MKECLRLITERRSITFFDPAKEVPDELCMTVMIVARAYGLETHPMEGFDEERLKEFLGVDKDKLIPVMLAIGYKDPQRELLPRAYRFKFEEFGRFL
jgi:hypothetical protein